MSKDRMQHAAEMIRASARQRRETADLEATALERFADAIEGMPAIFGDLRSPVESIEDMLGGDVWKAVHYGLVRKAEGGDE